MSGFAMRGAGTLPDRSRASKRVSRLHWRSRDYGKLAPVPHRADMTVGDCDSGDYGGDYTGRTNLGRVPV